MSFDPSAVADTSLCNRCGESAEAHTYYGCECLHEHEWSLQGGYRVWLGRCDGGCDPHPYVLLDSRSVCPDRLGTFEAAEDPRGQS